MDKPQDKPLLMADQKALEMAGTVAQQAMMQIMALGFHPEAAVVVLQTAGAMAEMSVLYTNEAASREVGATEVARHHSGREVMLMHEQIERLKKQAHVDHQKIVEHLEKAFGIPKGAPPS